jgi:hypothetical protein
MSRLRILGGPGESTGVAVSLHGNGNGNGVHLPKDDRERSNVKYAFVSSPADAARLGELQAESDASLLNSEGASLEQLIGGDIQGLRKFIRRRLHVVLPVYNQKATIGHTIDYLQSAGVDLANVTAASASTDGSDDIMKAKGVEVVDQYAFLKQALDLDRFLALMHVNNLKELRGKGLTMFAAHLKRVLDEREKQSNWTVQVDTDITNIGTKEGEWDPVSYFGHALQDDNSVGAIKAAKNGRNNQPTHIFLNTLADDGELGEHYQRIAMDRWVFTGEYGWQSPETERLRWSTGYSIETILAASQLDLGLKRRQVNIPQDRIDGQNLLSKETVMYTEILATLRRIVRFGRSLHEMNLHELDVFNGAQQGSDSKVIWMMAEKDEEPGPEATPNIPVTVKRSRLIPDIKTLLEEGIVHRG